MLQHGCEIWTRQKQHEDRLQVMQMQYSSRVQGVMKADKVRNGDRHRLNQEAFMKE